MTIENDYSETELLTVAIDNSIQMIFSEKKATKNILSNKIFNFNNNNKKTFDKKKPTRHKL